MKGGLNIKSNYTRDTAFLYFIKNSTISYLSSGTYGIVLKCKLNDGIESPYENIRTIYKKKEVRMIIIKFLLLHSSYTYNMDFTLGDRIIKRYSDNIKNFKDEVTFQTDIFNKTKDNLDPICPSIIFDNYLIRGNEESSGMMITLLGAISKRVDNIGVKNLFRELVTRMTYEDEIYKENEKYKNSTFGLIGMELMDDYVILNNIDKKIHGTIYENIARLRLIELAVKTGYSHNDFHKGNILVNVNANGYYGDKKGHVLLIDFGYTKEIPKDLLDNIRKLYDENRFNEILDIFYNDKRLHNEFNFENNPIYGWIVFKNSIENPTNIKITNDEITHLKDGYTKYVEQIGLQYKKVDEEKKEEEKKELPIIQEIKPTTEEPTTEEPTKTRKRKAEGGKRKSNKSMKQKPKINKSRQSKRRQSKRRQSKHRQSKHRQSKQR